MLQRSTRGLINSRPALASQVLNTEVSLCTCWFSQHATKYWPQTRNSLTSPYPATSTTTLRSPGRHPSSSTRFGPRQLSQVSIIPLRMSSNTAQSDFVLGPALTCAANAANGVPEFIPRIAGDDTITCELVVGIRLAVASRAVHGCPVESRVPRAADGGAAQDGGQSGGGSAHEDELSWEYHG